MKEFLKYVFATITGIICTGVFLVVLTTIMLISLAATSSQKPSLQKGSVLHLRLEGSILEQAEENPMAQLFGESALEEQGLDQLLKAVKVAKENKDIKGIYIESGAMSGDYASLEELRKALVDFKKSGKFILAYGDTFTQGAYYIASVADQILLNPSGTVAWHGLASEPIFFKELLEKVGVKMQVFRVGKYKSAVEPFTSTSMSEENRQQIQSFISDIWSRICLDVSQSRNIKVDSLNAYADRYTALVAAPELRKMKLVDSISYIDGVRDKLRSLSGQEKIHLVKPSELALLDEGKEEDDKIAVYYAFGDIVDQAATTSFGSQSQIVGSKVVEDLDKLAKDKDIKAVVLRINSGGGSAYASEQMWRAIQLLKKEKPVVVSMGGLAASGGYYMSCGADFIVADPTTLTGSIGIFGMIPDATGLLTDKLGLHFDMVKTNESSDFGAVGRPFNAGESAALQAYIERGYALFLKRVADGRKMRVADVDNIAQGRVWTGNQALKLKLVDRLGTLEDAIAEAARRAKLKKYSTTAAPAPAPWIEKLVNKTKSDYMESQLRAVLGEYYSPLLFAKGLKGTDCIQARIPFDPNLK